MELPRWQDAESVGATPGGATQPFYHILIDSRDRRHPSKLPVIAYVAQDCLSAPEVHACSQPCCMHSLDCRQFLGHSVLVYCCVPNNGWFRASR